MSRSAALKLELRQSGRIRPSLDKLKQALSDLGNPQRDFRSVLIVGTNGKGSTAAMTEALLRGHGVHTGLYTSPHLVRVEERVRVLGVPLEADALEGYLGHLDGYPDLTYFETLTAAAFTAFSDMGVEVAVLEAGMGGSWDATRAAASEIAGLTNVGTDHQTWLGGDRPAIARDKGAALAAARLAVLGAGVDESIRMALEAPHAVAAGETVRWTAASDSGIVVSWAEGDAALRMPLAGRYQIENLQLAVALYLKASASGWCPSLDPRRLRAAVEGLRWPGRLSSHRVAGRDVVMDCAHNLEGARALAGHLADLGVRFNLLFSCLDDKPVEAMAEVLRPAVGRVAVCELADDRAMPARRLAAAFPDAAVAASPVAGLAVLADPVLVAGSVRLVGALLGAAGWEGPW